MYFINLHPISGSVRIILCTVCCERKDVDLRLHFHTEKDRDFISMKLFKLSKLLIETPSSWMVPRVPASSLPRSLLWYFLSDFWPTILCTNIFKGLLKICFSLRNNNVYLVIFFLHVLFVWRLCRIENVFWESLTCHKCFPSRNSKFRASKNRFYCVFPSQNSCKKEVFLQEVISRQR